MLEVAVRILAVAALVDAVLLLNDAGDPEFNLSSASAEAELYLDREEDGLLGHPFEGKDVYMIKRLKAAGEFNVKPSEGGTRKPWKNIFEKLSDVSPSFEESDHLKTPLRIIVDDAGHSEEAKESGDRKSIREQMEIAQRWFPILLRRAIDNMLNNNTKKELNELVEQLTFRTWKSEDFNGSEQKFVDWMLTVPFHARKRDSEEDSDQRLQKRSNCCSFCDTRSNCQPCIVNIFNNSQIGYVMLGPDGKLPCVDGCGNCYSPQPLNFSIVLPKVGDTCGQPNAINVEYIPNCESPPVVTECTTTTTTECPTTESTTEARCEDPLAYVQYETSTSAPYKYDYASTLAYKPPPPPSFYESPPCPCNKDKPHPKPIYPWYNYPEPEYRPKNHNYGAASYEDRYEPYNNLPFDIPSAEISDCSQEVDYPSNYHVKRDPQYLDKKNWIYKLPTQKTTKSSKADDASVRLILDLPPTFQSQEDLNLRPTRAKNLERPVVAKALGSSRYNRERPFPPIRSQRVPKFSSFESGSLKRSI